MGRCYAHERYRVFMTLMTEPAKHLNFNLDELNVKMMRRTLLQGRKFEKKYSSASWETFVQIDMSLN